MQPYKLTVGARSCRVDVFLAALSFISAAECRCCRRAELQHSQAEVDEHSVQ